MSVVDLNKEREKRDGPDADCICIVDGVKWFKFSAEYIAENGASFTLPFWALDFPDAEKRVAAIRQTLELRGQLYSFVEG